MYRFWRDSHLLLGLFFFAAVVLFAVSSLHFSHRGWFGSEPAVSETTLAVDPGRTSSARTLARHLMREHGFRGELHEVREAGSEVRFDISRIGTVHEVRFERGQPEVRVRTRLFPLLSMLTWMHATFGFHHEYAPHNFWGALMLLTSLGLLALGGTGLYLWFQLRTERRIGAALLFGHVVVGAWLIALMWIG